MKEVRFELDGAQSRAGQKADDPLAGKRSVHELAVQLLNQIASLRQRSGREGMILELRRMLPQYGGIESYAALNLAMSWGLASGEREEVLRAKPPIAKRGPTVETEARGEPLPSAARTKFEGSLGVDLGGVRLHQGAASAAAASAIDAQACTVGQDIHFASGRFAPDSKEGELLLAHEVAHTVQQGGVGPSVQRQSEVSMPGDAAEIEADQAAHAMAAGRPFAVASEARGASRAIMRATAPIAAPVKGAPSSAPASAPAVTPGYTSATQVKDDHGGDHWKRFIWAIGQQESGGGKAKDIIRAGTEEIAYNASGASASYGTLQTIPESGLGLMDDDAHPAASASTRGTLTKADVNALKAKEKAVDAFWDVVFKGKNPKPFKVATPDGKQVDADLFPAEQSLQEAASRTPAPGSVGAGNVDEFRKARETWVNDRAKKPATMTNGALWTASTGLQLDDLRRMCDLVYFEFALFPSLKRAYASQPKKDTTTAKHAASETIDAMNDPILAELAMGDKKPMLVPYTRTDEVIWEESHQGFVAKACVLASPLIPGSAAAKPAMADELGSSSSMADGSVAPGYQGRYLAYAKKYNAYAAQTAFVTALNSDAMGIPELEKNLEQVFSNAGKKVTLGAPSGDRTKPSCSLSLEHVFKLTAIIHNGPAGLKIPGDYISEDNLDKNQYVKSVMDYYHGFEGKK